MTMKQDREADLRDADQLDVPDEKLDPIVSGWQTALDEDVDDDEAADPTADQVARGEDVEVDRPNFERG